MFLILQMVLDMVILFLAYLLQEQSGVCAICQNPEHNKHNYTGEVTNLSVDHNHYTGYIRGLLCKNCNLVLGNSFESISTL